MIFQKVLTVAFLALVANTFGAMFMITLALLALMCNSAVTTMTAAYQTTSA